MLSLNQRRWSELGFVVGALDSFRHIRDWIAHALVFVSIRFVGSEVSFEEVVRERLEPSEADCPVSLTAVKDPDLVLATAQSALRSAEDRRQVITDKCKTLLTLGSLFVGLSAFLLPKDALYTNWVIKSALVLSFVLFLHAIALLLIFFVTGTSMEVVLDQSDVLKTSNDLKLALSESYFACKEDADGRSNYLVEVYRAARFSFLSAMLVGGMTLVYVGFTAHAPPAPPRSITQELLQNQELIRKLKGPQGEPGPKGADAHVDLNDLARRVATDLQRRRTFPRQ